VKRFAALTAGLATSLVAPAVRALPQWTVGATVGGGAAELGERPHPAFHLGVRGGALFLRDREREIGVGPYLDAGTMAFETLDLGGGLEALFPVEPLALVAGAGMLARLGAHPGPAFEGTLFLGSRSLNFHGAYGLTSGLFAQTRVGFGPARGTDVLGGIQIDLELVGLPFLLVYEALR
jgi:hypothetical protein